MNIVLNEPYHACRNVLGQTTWLRLSTSFSEALSSGSLSTALTERINNWIPAFLPDLARLDEAYFSVAQRKNSIPKEAGRINVNPTLKIIELSWKHLTEFLDPDRDHAGITPVRTNERILIWYNPRANCVTARPATDEDLLVLKMVVEETPSESIATQGNVPVGAVDHVLYRAGVSGLVLSPPSLIRRDRTIFRSNNDISDQYLSSPFFTLQWHITQACDLSCKHCYDRSDRRTVTIDQALHILDDLREFCKSRNVTGGVSFTGGNPLLHPAFAEIYSAATERGFTTAILGNPAPPNQIKELIAIQMPTFFQVSLEGLQQHNDAIRGPGHFERVLTFLELLKELKVSSMVMLTLTSENINQVLPLADMLRGKADVLHFNRLSLVGEGANLSLPDKQQFRSFLESYLGETKINPVLGIKDNLINIMRLKQGLAAFGGCTGYGCGAAFNFITLLADGDVHACRKFPSPLGNIYQQTIAEIYDLEIAQRYRSGCVACRSCKIFPVCGGCLASAHSHKLNIFQHRDPFCFMHDH